MAKTAKGTGRDNKQIILDTAVAMIGEKGLDKTSLAQISKASGLSKGTLYYYYASKNELIFDIADQHMERITTALFDMIDETSVLTWEDLLTAFFDTLLNSEARSRLHLYLVREAVSGNDSLKARFQKTYAQWFDMVGQAYEKMPTPKADVANKAKVIVAVVDGFILQALLEADKIQTKDIVRLMLRVIEE